ncbi:MAG: hypothetical protein LBI70_02390 [Rickettsiales bacterium]|jgi:glutaredoxin|nr:hypothetical protein [Rickettsiales bacterium]
MAGNITGSKYSRRFISMVISLLISSTVFSLGRKINKNVNSREKNFADSSVHVFTQKLCPHCRDFRKFLEENNLYSDYDIKLYDLEERRNLDLLLRYAKRYNLSVGNLVTPIIFFKGNYFIAFERENGDDKKFLEFLKTTALILEREDGASAREVAPLSPRLFLSALSRSNFGFKNIYTFLFLFLIIFCCNFAKRTLLVCSYFCFYGLTDFLFLTGFLSIELLGKSVRILLLFVGYLQIYKFLKGLSENDEIASVGLNSGKYDLSGPVPNTTILYITLLTVLASSIKFLNPASNLGFFISALGGAGARKEFSYALLFSVFHSFSNALAVVIFWKIICRYKNCLINYLTIINNILLSITGILILFV